MHSDNGKPHVARSGPASTDSGTPEVRAAGAVLWRANAQGRTEVAVVHRPRYDDWSLPKGKPDPGETIAHTAAREVTEETGLACTLSRWLARTVYEVPARDGGTRDKQVDYFVARAGAGTFVPNEEVDRLCWMETGPAAEQLSYPHDRRILQEFDALPVVTSTVLLVRHAKAGKRSEFSGDDRLRPLSKGGLRQQRALRTFLALFGPQRVHSVPRTRCEQTVAPLAEDIGTEIVSAPALSEEGYESDPAAAERELLRIASCPGASVVCSQGGAIPGLVGGLASATGLPVEEIRSRKSSVWALTFLPGAAVGNGTGSAPRLVAADYHPSPRPESDRRG